MKVAGLEESSCIVTHENVPFPMEIMTEWAQSLRIMKMRNAELYLKEATVIYGFHPLGARLPELASKLERLDCSYLFNSDHWSKLSTDYSSGKRWYEIIEVHFAEMTGAVAPKQASVTTLHVSVVWKVSQKLRPKT